MTGTFFQRMGNVRPIYVSLALLGAATLFRMTLTPVLGPDYAFITYYPVILFTALVGGWKQGVLATLISSLLAITLFLDRPWGLEQLLVVLIYVVITLLMIVMAELFL